MARSDDRDPESGRILKRVDAETEARMPASQAEGSDWAELWGTRIGRVLAAILFIGLVWYLGISLLGGGS
ncbi:MAG TPA: hypothetical protein VNS02_03860 [Rhizobiaceae bacterium]|nr:hypothetical protein [Rhizobiaceae bacterium]